MKAKTKKPADKPPSQAKTKSAHNARARVLKQSDEKRSSANTDEPAAVWVDVEKLLPWVRNPRRNDANVVRVRKSIERFGFAAPIVARKADGEVIAGHTRLKAAIQMGMARVPVRYMDLEPDEAHLLAMADNRLNELSEWDSAEALSILSEFGEDDAELAGWSADDMKEMAKEVAKLGAGGGGDVIEDEAPEPPKNPITKLGDVWVLGDHVLVCGDCRDVDPVALSGGPIGAVVTDPPYGMSFQSNHRKQQHQAIAGDRDGLMLLFACSIEATHSKYVWCRWDNVRDVPAPTSLITWVKNNWSMGDLDHAHARQTEVCLFYPGSNHEWTEGRPSDVVKHDRTDNELHPTQKPVTLMAEVIGWTRGVVFDPFLGSGTTLIAAEQLGRKCIGVELSPAYCDVIVERWQNLTNRKAVRRGATKSKASRGR